MGKPVLEEIIKDIHVEYHADEPVSEKAPAFLSLHVLTQR